MSILSVFSHKHVQKISFITLGLSGVLACAYVLAPVSGAYFFDQKHMDISSKSPTLSLEVTGENGDASNGEYDITNLNLLPGNTLTYPVMVKNTGTGFGWLRISLSSRTQNAGQPLSAVQLSALHYRLDDSSGDETVDNPSFDYDAETDAYSSVSIGMLSPGQAKMLMLTQTLDPSAGNEWQGADILDGLTFNLTQN